MKSRRWLRQAGALGGDDFHESVPGLQSAPESHLAGPSPAGINESARDVRMLSLHLIFAEVTTPERTS